MGEDVGDLWIACAMCSTIMHCNLGSWVLNPIVEYGLGSASWAENPQPTRAEPIHMPASVSYVKSEKASGPRLLIILHILPA